MLRYERDAMTGRTPDASNGESALAIICGGGSLPFALADAAVRRGRSANGPTRSVSPPIRIIGLGSASSGVSSGSPPKRDAAT